MILVLCVLNLLIGICFVIALLGIISLFFGISLDFLGVPAAFVAYFLVILFVVLGRGD